MRIAILALLVWTTAFTDEIRAQEIHKSVFVAPSGVSAPGGTRRAYQLGGGIERLLERGFGAGADVSAVLPGQGKLEDTVGILAIDLYYHAKKGTRALGIQPFAGGGYSLMFRDFTANMVNFGGGINYWLTANHGLRLEFRDNVGSPRNGERMHYWGIRIGMDFK